MHIPHTKFLIGANNKFHIPFCEPYSFSYQNSFGNQVKQRMISKVKQYLVIIFYNSFFLSSKQTNCCLFPFPFRFTIQY